MLDVNLFGAMHVMQQAMKVMRAQGQGHIVNVASLAGRRASRRSRLLATKFALVGSPRRCAWNSGRGYPRLSGHARSGGHAARDERAARPRMPQFWPERLNMPPSWVTQCIFSPSATADRGGRAPGTALLEKLAALAPGTATRCCAGS